MDGEDAVVGDEANPLEVAQDGVMSQFAESLANLNIQEEQPQMHAMLLKLSQSLSTLSLAQDLLSKQSKALLESDRKLKVEAAVKSISNPMSVRSIRHNFRVLHLIEDLIAVFSPEGIPLVATDLVAVNDIIAAASGVLLEVTRLLKREMELHSVAQTSHLGWKTVGELDKGELAIEEQDQARILPSTAIVAAERQYMSYHLDLAKTLSFTRGGGSRGGRGGSRGGSHGGGRGGGRGGRGGGRGRGGSKSMGVDSAKSGRVTKPRYGGCHRCGGPHFVRACPKPLQKD